MYDRHLEGIKWRIDIIRRTEIALILQFALAKWNQLFIENLLIKSIQSQKVPLSICLPPFWSYNHTYLLECYRCSIFVKRGSTCLEEQKVWQERAEEYPTAIGYDYMKETNSFGRCVIGFDMDSSFLTRFSTLECKFILENIKDNFAKPIGYWWDTVNTIRWVFIASQPEQSDMIRSELLSYNTKSN